MERMHDEVLAMAQTAYHWPIGCRCADFLRKAWREFLFFTIPP